MKAILFNFHDIVLVWALCICVFLAIYCRLMDHFTQPSKRLLVSIFSLYALVIFDTLVFWGEGLRGAAFSIAPWSLTIFSFATFALGPCLYWFVGYQLSAKRAWHWREFLHLAPALFVPVYLYWVCYRYPFPIQRDLILSFAIYSVPESHFSAFMTLKLVSPVVYCVLSMGLWVKQRKVLAQTSFEFKHLVYLVFGLSLIRVWVLLIHLVGLVLPVAVSDALGILGNYLTLALLLSIAWVYFRQPKFIAGSDTLVIAQPQHKVDVTEVAEQIQQAMDQLKPYLNPQLTLNRFADLITTSPRQVSAAINRAFNQNFQEYINRHRIEEAKRLLSSPELAELSIVEVAKKSGFNSKATFNRLFKSITGVPPTEYRQRAQVCEAGQDLPK